MTSIIANKVLSVDAMRCTSQMESFSTWGPKSRVADSKHNFQCVKQLTTADAQRWTVLRAHPTAIWSVNSIDSILVECMCCGSCGQRCRNKGDQCQIWLASGLDRSIVISFNCYQASFKCIQAMVNLFLSVSVCFTHVKLLGLHESST